MNISYFSYLPVRYGYYLLQVGLAVGDIDNIQKNATMDRYVTQVNFAVLHQWCTITIVNCKGKWKGKTSFLFFSSTNCSSFPALVGNGRRIRDSLGFWIPRSGLLTYYSSYYPRFTHGWSWILDSSLWIPDCRDWIPDSMSGDLGFRITIVSVIRISWPVFRIPKPGIPDFTNKFPIFWNRDSRFPFMGRAWKENDKKGEEECLVEWSELFPLDQHLRFAFSHLTVRERQRKLGKNCLENDQMLSARTIFPISVYIFHKFRVTFIFCFKASDKWHLKRPLAWKHICGFLQVCLSSRDPFLSANENDDHFLFEIRSSCSCRLRNSSLDGFEDWSNSRSMWTSQTKKHH